MWKQLRLDLEDVSTNVGDVFYVESRDEPYCFVKEGGLVTRRIPEGTKIITKAYSIVIGAVMPEITGLIHYDNGVACVYASDWLGKIQMSRCHLLKLHQGDVITILDIPQLTRNP